MSNAPRLPVAPSAAPSISIVAPAPSIPCQAPMFARNTLIESPQQSKTADALGEVLADDQHYYYVKGDSNGQLVRASEWICTHLAEDVHIGAPLPMIIKMNSGSIVFGSRRIAQVSDQITTASLLISPSLRNGASSAPGLQGLLSSIYAFDMFINNDDRHFGNYLTVEDFGVRRLYTFDFSRALFWHWPFQNFPAMPCNTLKCGRIIRDSHGFDHAAAHGTLDRIGGLAADTLQGFISRMPADWLPQDVCDAFMDWWSNGGRAKRLADLRKGISDGTLL